MAVMVPPVLSEAAVKSPPLLNAPVDVIVPVEIPDDVSVPVLMIIPCVAVIVPAVLKLVAVADPPAVKPPRLVILPAVRPLLTRAVLTESAVAETAPPLVMAPVNCPEPPTVKSRLVVMPEALRVAAVTDDAVMNPPVLILPAVRPPVTLTVPALTVPAVSI